MSGGVRSRGGGEKMKACWCRNFFYTCAMADSGQMIPATQWDQELVFTTLADANRRRLFLSLVRNGAQTADSLKGSQPVSSATKHLAVMREAGLVEISENPRDGRRYLYRLTPKVPVTKTEKGAVVDFGFCMFRL